MLGALREIMKQAIPKAAASVGYQVRSEAYKEFADYLAPYLDIGSCHDRTSVLSAVDAIPDDELIAQFPKQILKGSTALSLWFFTTQKRFRSLQLTGIGSRQGSDLCTMLVTITELSSANWMEPLGLDASTGE